MAPSKAEHSKIMLRKIFSLTLLCSCVFLLGGCYQDVNVSLHEPGKYEGRTDPLLAKLKTPDLQAKLQQRFKLSQTDR